MAPQYDNLLLQIDDGIATLTLNRPDARNALTREMLTELGSALQFVTEEAGRSIRSLILTGAGRAFSAGGDVKAMGDGRSALTQRHRQRGYQQLVIDLHNLAIPVISLVRGPAAGGGANLALAADFVFATPDAVFIQAFGRIGMVPDLGGLYLLPRLIGLQKAKELIFTARKLAAGEAMDLGLVYRIVEPETADQTVRNFAERFRHASTSTIGLVKCALNQSYNLDLPAMLELEANLQGLSVSSTYFQNAVQRFSDKQPLAFDWDAEQTES